MFRQEYRHGRPIAPLTEEPTSNGASNGTCISFRYDPKVFSSDAAFDGDTISKRLRELAFLNAAATFEFKRLKGGEEQQAESFRYEGGIAEYVAQLVEGNETLHDCIHFTRTSDACDVRCFPHACWLSTI